MTSMDPPTPAGAPAGLVRAIRGLFAGESAEPVRIAGTSTRPEGQGAGGSSVAGPSSRESLADMIDQLVAGARDDAGRAALVARLGALGSVGAPAIIEALIEAEDRSVRRVLIEALTASAREDPDILLEMLADARWFVVRNGVTVLGEVGGEAAVEHLTRALAHTHPRVRREAVMALARLGGTDPAQLILGMLEDHDEGVRGAAAMAMGVLGFERAVRPLLKRLDEESSTDVQEEILRALGQLGDPGAVPAVEKRADPSFFSRTPSSVRIAAYRALAAIGTPHARQVLEAGLEAREPEIRNAVRSALRERG